MVTRAIDAPTFEETAACVHCGMCLEVCPTYRELKVEMDSPRGRLYLMRGLADGRLLPAPSVVEHLDRCLDCRACETACPSNVHYGVILEKTRSLLQPTRPLSLAGRVLRWLALSVLLPHPQVQRAFFKLGWAFERSGLMRVARWFSARRLVRGWLARAIALNVPIPRRSFRARSRGAWNSEKNAFVFPARGPTRMRVALLTGCLADTLFADVTEATVRVLTARGCDVEVLGDEVCCGALHIHNGARTEAKALARRNVRVFRDRRYDAIVSTAAGCSAELRHYGELLGAGEDDEIGAFASRVCDVSELLDKLGSLHTGGQSSRSIRVAYDDPCHLLHAQKIAASPRRVLERIPGIKLVPLDEADACCGGAGVYFMLQPELSQKIAARKVDAIAASGAEVVATGNPGCLMQIRGALVSRGLNIRVVHPVQLVDEADRETGMVT